MELKKLISTFDQGELAVIKSILDAENILFRVKGENFSLVVPASIMVNEEDLERAKDLIKDIESSLESGSNSEDNPNPDVE
ncbi:MAG: DUF2007 domain-containing protein [Candidatus Electryonea clarkiae]|nr:DUF2007 domain-containing protein [Candidatus Electryonea clarkiae]